MSDNNQSSVTLRERTSNELLLKKMLVHPLSNFDEKAFLDLLEHSLSLALVDKKRIIDSIGELSQFQIDELIKVFEDERIEFRKLVATEGEIIKGLVIKAQNEWEQLKDIYQDEIVAQQKVLADAEEAEKIKKNLGL